MSDTGNSNQITRNYLDSLLVETRYMDACIPDTAFELFGERFSSPIMTAALSHLDHFMFPGAAQALAKGARDAGCALWYGMAEENEIEALSATGGKMIEIIKPYADRALIEKKIRHAQAHHLLAVGIDIDHAFNEEGGHDVVDGQEMAPITSGELAEFCRMAGLPLIVKGVLSLKDAEKCLAAGASGLVLSHHNGRIPYAMPPLAVLPQIAEMVQGRIPVFVDDEIRTGMDAFKALSLGAAGVCIGRPLMSALKQDPENGVRDYLLKAARELSKAMACCGCADLKSMDSSVIHQL